MVYYLYMVDANNTVCRKCRGLGFDYLSQPCSCVTAPPVGWTRMTFNYRESAVAYLEAEIARACMVNVQGTWRLWDGEELA